MPVAAIILAAGASTRLGEAKQLLLLGGERLLERALRMAIEAELRPVVIVLGAQASAIQAVCKLSGAQIVLHEDWSQGMGSSLRAGLVAVPKAPGVVVMTCDQPAVNAAHLCALCLDLQAPMASAYAGRHGVPAYFPAAAFERLRTLGGDQGARDLLRNAPAVPLPGGELDVDTAESLRALRQVYGP